MWCCRLAQPALATIALFYLVLHWNEFFRAMIYINDQTKWPLQVVLRQFVVEGDKVAIVGATNANNNIGIAQINIRALKAGMILITILPILAIYPLILKFFTKGTMSRGAEGMREMGCDSTPRKSHAQGCDQRRINQGGDYNDARKLLLASTAMVMIGALAVPALAQTTLRLVSKELLTTNPDDVKEIEAIEAALKAQGTDLDIQLVDLPTSLGLCRCLGVMLLSGDIPDLIYFQGGDQKMADQGILEDLNP